jgi:hypothetical protein
VAVSFHENWDLVEPRRHVRPRALGRTTTGRSCSGLAELCDTPCPPDDGQAELQADLTPLVERGAA